MVSQLKKGASPPPAGLPFRNQGALAGGVWVQRRWNGRELRQADTKIAPIVQHTTRSVFLSIKPNPSQWGLKTKSCLDAEHVKRGVTRQTMT